MVKDYHKNTIYVHHLLLYMTISESCSVDTIIKHRNITWEKLAKALDGIQGYEFAAEKIRAECIGK